MNTLHNVNIEEIARKGTAIYEKIKTRYEPQDSGKFLAIDVDSTDISIAETSTAAVEEARAKHPGKVFYVVKIGFSAVEVLSSLTRQKLGAGRRLSC